MIMIDIPIPKNCLVCPMCNEYLMCGIPCNGKGWGETDVHEYDHNRPEWCPIKDIVMCKDCKHQDPDRCANDKGEFVCRIGRAWKPEDHFCALGERKEGDGE